MWSSVQRGDSALKERLSVLSAVACPSAPFLNAASELGNLPLCPEHETPHQGEKPLGALAGRLSLPAGVAGNCSAMLFLNKRKCLCPKTLMKIENRKPKALPVSSVHLTHLTWALRLGVCMPAGHLPRSLWKCLPTRQNTWGWFCRATSSQAGDTWKQSISHKDMKVVHSAGGSEWLLCPCPLD